ncbi:MAG: glycine cleavage system protein GcvH [Thermomicrobium sp.]|jgi:glycine cleavage system H protein|uniref:glycine cleavage system protein GcvH n=1 Tax=Thermomicrobium sp. TaxID=1969469 RepID=UPI001B225A29|nr:glycine cleavage system protein GcvH [Thermomicrobium sp.]MBO9350202.1 glycine cleavage system protein GcvH [Thermomicrobium sp.]
MAEVREGLRYTRTHEWVRVEGDVAVVGVTDFAQSELGDITYLELPEPGTVVKQGESMGVIESVKAASDIYAPVSGEVVEVNRSVVDSPELVNKSPYDEAWLAKIRLSAAEELERLMDAAAYRQFLTETAAMA